MKIYKRILSFVLLIATFLGCSLISSNAAYTENIISFEEYKDTLQHEYEKYGMTLEIELGNEDTIFTRDMLLSHLSMVEDLSNSFAGEYIGSTMALEPIPQSNNNDTIEPKAMYARYAYSVEFLVSADTFPLNFLATATFEAVCYGTVDLQNGAVVTVEDYSVSHVSSHNLESYDLDLTCTIYNHGYSDNSVQMQVLGTAEFAWTEPTTNITYRSSKDVAFADNFNPHEHLHY